VTPDDAKHLKPGDPVRFKSKPFDIEGIVVAPISPWRISIQWKEHIAPLNYHPLDMADIHRRKRSPMTPNEELTGGPLADGPRSAPG